MTLILQTIIKKVTWRERFRQSVSRYPNYHELFHIKSFYKSGNYFWKNIKIWVLLRGHKFLRFVWFFAIIAWHSEQKKNSCDKTQLCDFRQRKYQPMLYSASTCSMTFPFFWPTFAGIFIFWDLKLTPGAFVSGNLIPEQLSTLRVTWNTKINEFSGFLLVNKKRIRIIRYLQKHTQ